MMGRESVGITARLQALAPVLFVGTIVTHLMIGHNPWSRLSMQGNLFFLFLLFIILGAGSNVALHAMGRTRTAANLFSQWQCYLARCLCSRRLSPRTTT